ncbi:hypothetical protein ACNKHS_04875 [Shigella flexneri]
MTSELPSSTRPSARMTTVSGPAASSAGQGVSHLEGDDFGPVIAQAQQMAGFPYSEIPHLITVGFGREETLLGAADS